LKDLGFITNEYDPCLAIEVVNGEHIPMAWQFDDLKVPHLDRDMVGKVIKWFKSTHGTMRVSDGYQHNYLGMDIGFLYQKQLR
jgi:hypothetical protein